MWEKSSISVSLSLVFLVCVVSVFLGCEGKEGPAGPAGADGASGGTAACGTCHNVTTSVLGKQAQWATSMHAIGTSWGRGSSDGCATCHSSEGFTAMLAEGLDANSSVTASSSPTSANCRTCHPIHKNYDETDYSLTTTAAVKLTGSIPNDTVVDIGKGNLCVNCHQTRNRGYGLDPNASGDIEINSSHWGPHHGTQSNILVGVGAGAFEVKGSLAYTNTPHATMVKDGCVTCHVHNDSHTFEPSDDACTTCHGADFDYSAQQEEIAALFEELNQALVKEGILAGDAEEGYHPVVGTTTMAKAGALFNAFLIADDGSMGAHNFKHTKALLQNSIEVF